MNISPGLIAKTAAGTAAVAASSAGIAYRNEISRILFGEDVGALNKKLENLGLPDTCRFERGKIEKDCGKLTEAVLKAINFDGKTGDPTISGIVEASDKLKIRWDGDKEIFPDGIKIIFEVSANVTVNGGGLNIDWKLGTDPEYKIKEGSTIEEAWTIENLAKRVKLTYDSNNSKCAFGEKINVFMSDSDYVIGAKIKDNANGEKKLNCAKDSVGYYQGLLLNFSGGSDEGIELEFVKDTVKKGNIEKIKASGSESVTYQIKEHEVDGQKHWFLSKK